MRLDTCAVCGNPNYIGLDLCKTCYNTWTVTGTAQKPEWLLELVRMEYRFQQKIDYQVTIPFADLSPVKQLEVGYEPSEPDK